MIHGRQGPEIFEARCARRSVSHPGFDPQKMTPGEYVPSLCSMLVKHVNKKVPNKNAQARTLRREKSRQVAQNESTATTRDGLCVTEMSKKE